MTRSRFVRAVVTLGSLTLLSVGTAGCGFVSMHAKGTWQDSSGNVVLTFTQEGLITGTDGCNIAKGTWEEHGNDVTLTYRVDDTNVCPDVDQWLINPAHATIDGTTMQVFDASNAHLGDLEQQSK